MFNFGLYVYFDDEVYYDDDVRSISLERMYVIKWDREMERIFGYYRYLRLCLISFILFLILDRVERYFVYGVIRGSFFLRFLFYVIFYGYRFDENNGELKF